MNQYTFNNSIAKRDWELRKTQHQSTIRKIMNTSIKKISVVNDYPYISPPLKKYREIIDDKSFSNSVSTESFEILNRMDADVIKDGLLSQNSIKKLSPVIKKVSLRSGVINKERKRISSENLRLSHRLYDIKSGYAVENLAKRYQTVKKYRKNISNPHVLLGKKTLKMRTISSNKGRIHGENEKVRHERSISELIDIMRKKGLS
ncbi:unnamed protein product [Blepharisma stoltei]|uniref:Uncharacterized protein n=1 Tax=Blepharisma stoltei TaxID=1481888 RepID=A0AAU9JLR7_9CILI|nr:unnamed protein product [Blepharisma stoltei]